MPLEADAPSTRAAYTKAMDGLYALGQELAPLPPLPDGTPAPRRKWDLAHMRTLCAALGNPQNQFPSILIAGTNGKGSTAATLASILAAAGYRTGLYTSPHLIRVNERIQILDKNRHPEVLDKKCHPERSSSSTTNAVEGPAVIFSGDEIPGAPSIASSAMGGMYDLPQEIPDDTFARLYFHVDDTAAALIRSGSLPHHPSFFEMLTALGFLYFAESKVDIAVLEVGLGGRLDATNIVEPLLSIITDISLDHQEYLGNTIAEITREKAGILRRNGTLITLPQHPQANQAIGEAAADLDLRAISAADYIPSQLPAGLSSFAAAGVPDPRLCGLGWEAGVPDPHLCGLGWEAGVPDPPGAPYLAASSPDVGGVPQLPPNRYTLTLDNQPLHVDSPLPGHHQQRNIALAIAAAAELRARHGYTIPNSAIEAGICNTAWPGRLEFLPPNLLLDVAHNPAGAWTLRAAIARLPEDQPRTLLFSCLSDKNLTEISRILLPLFDSSPTGDRPQDHVVLAPIPNPRATPVEDLLAAARALDIPAQSAPDLAAALALARDLTPPGGLILATGSVYLVGAVRDLALHSQLELARR